WVIDEVETVEVPGSELSDLAGGAADGVLVAFPAGLGVVDRPQTVGDLLDAVEFPFGVIEIGLRSESVGQVVESGGRFGGGDRSSDGRALRERRGARLVPGLSTFAAGGHDRDEPNESPMLLHDCTSWHAGRLFPSVDRLVAALGIPGGAIQASTRQACARSPRAQTPLTGAPYECARRPVNEILCGSADYTFASLCGKRPQSCGDFQYPTRDIAELGAGTRRGSRLGMRSLVLLAVVSLWALSARADEWALGLRATAEHVAADGDPEGFDLGAGSALVRWRFWPHWGVEAALETARGEHLEIDSLVVTVALHLTPQSFWDWYLFLGAGGGSGHTTGGPEWKQSVIRLGAGLERRWEHVG